ncbi:MAG: hypothetical protein ABSG43_26215, partial [Solirubrobacteraceae bacterium]
MLIGYGRFSSVEWDHACCSSFDASGCEWVGGGRGLGARGAVPDLPRGRRRWGPESFERQAVIPLASATIPVPSRPPLGLQTEWRVAVGDQQEGVSPDA